MKQSHTIPFYSQQSVPHCCRCWHQHYIPIVCPCTFSVWGNSGNCFIISIITQSVSFMPFYTSNPNSHDFLKRPLDTSDYNKSKKQGLKRDIKVWIHSHNNNNNSLMSYFSIHMQLSVCAMSESFRGVSSVSHQLSISFLLCHIAHWQISF